MIQFKDIRLYVPANTSAERQSFISRDTPDIGFLMYPTQTVIKSTVKQRTNRVINLDQINKSMQRVKLHDIVGNDF